MELVTRDIVPLIDQLQRLFKCFDCSLRSLRFDCSLRSLRIAQCDPV
jgi:hypothetical protein